MVYVSICSKEYKLTKGNVFANIRSDLFEEDRENVERFHRIAR